MKMKMKMKMEMKMGKGVNCHTFILSLLIVLVVSVLIPFIITSPKPKPRRSHLTHTSFAGVKIHKNPPPSILDNLGVTSWPKWGCPPSKFPWTFGATETMYLLEGRVKVSVDGIEGSFEIAAGDLVVFPKGMKITWYAIETVNKHYSLEK